MKRLKILLYADAFNGKVGQSIQYVEFASQFGEVILVHPQSDMEFLLKHGDVLLVPGGADVSSNTYGEIPGFYNGRANAHYEYMDEHLLLPWLHANKPTIGICRGAQVINTVLGGTLHQHITGHVQGKDRHITTEEMYTDVEGFNVHEINTIHHQAVRELAPSLSLLGWSRRYQRCPSLRHIDQFTHHIYIEDKTNGRKTYKKVGEKAPGYPVVVEAFKSEDDSDLNIVAFQYHPEEFNCDFAIMQISLMLEKVFKAKEHEIN